MQLPVQNKILNCQHRMYFTCRYVCRQHNNTFGLICLHTHTDPKRAFMSTWIVICAGREDSPISSTSRWLTCTFPWPLRCLQMVLPRPITPITATCTPPACERWTAWLGRWKVFLMKQTGTILLSGSQVSQPHILQNSLYRCFLRIICISSSRVNFSKLRKVHSFLILPASHFRNCVLKHTVTRVNVLWCQCIRTWYVYMWHADRQSSPWVHLVLSFLTVLALN